MRVHIKGINIKKQNKSNGQEGKQNFQESNKEEKRNEIFSEE